MIKVILLTTGLLLCSSGPLAADDITEAIANAGDAYRQGVYTRALSELDRAGLLIRQKRALEAAATLPEPLDGWVAAEAMTEVGGNLPSGGLGASREYRKDDATTTIEMIVDSALLDTLAEMFASPELITANGGEIISIQGQDAVLSNSETDHPEILWLAGDQRLYVLRGEGANVPALKAYAEAIDVAALAAPSTAAEASGQSAE